MAQANDPGPYSVANFEDAYESSPGPATFDVGGHGSATPYSAAVTAIANKHMDEIRQKTAAILNLPGGWKKRFREFISSKNNELLDFLKVSVPTHPVFGPADILLRRFGNPQVNSSHPSVRDFILDDVSGTAYLDTINTAIDAARGTDTGITAHIASTQYLYEEYRSAGDDIIRNQTALKAKLDKLDRIIGKITNLFEIDPNEAYRPLMEASEEYIKKIFDENQISLEYFELMAAYRRFITIRDAIQMLRAPSVLENEPLCSICLTEAVCYTVTPCGHTFCQSCVRRQGVQCPMCRTTIKDRVKIYFG
jgi:Zinc finger, C3HC4 type (RING finger)